MSSRCLHLRGCQQLGKIGRCIEDRTVSEQRRRIAPFRVLPIEHSQVPKYAFALAAARLRGKLAVELPCDEMVMIPILDNPCVWDSGLNHPTRARPVCRQDRLPHHKDTDRKRMRLVQQFLDCGRPPQAGRSGRRQQQHQPGFVARAVEIMLELVEVILCQ